MYSFTRIIVFLYECVTLVNFSGSESAYFHVAYLDFLKSTEGGYFWDP